VSRESAFGGSLPCDVKQFGCDVEARGDEPASCESESEGTGAGPEIERALARTEPSTLHEPVEEFVGESRTMTLVINGRSAEVDVSLLAVLRSIPDHGPNLPPMLSSWRGWHRDGHTCMYGRSSVVNA